MKIEKITVSKDSLYIYLTEKNNCYKTIIHFTEFEKNNVIFKKNKKAHFKNPF